MTASKPPRSAPARLSRREALQPARWLPAVPPAVPQPLNRKRPPAEVQGLDGDPSLAPLSVIVFNRLAFGPRPGDLAAFNALGANNDARLTAWVDQQLNPAGINDSVCDALVAGANLPTLTKPLTQLWADHYRGSQGRTRPIEDVRAATFLRAVHSQRQLKEVLVDFWHNHFSIFAWDYAYASATWAHYDRDVIRAHALGNFRTLLQFVAGSPAMLYYLDNYINQVAGYNENFARECFELHTLGAENYLGVVADPFSIPQENGVAIGYCDNDVYEAARAFTGWRVNNGSSGAPADNGTFYYHAAWHDKANKLVLGQYLPANQADLEDGNEVLDLMAYHPGTARHIAGKLCRRLIADNPPQTVVDAAAAVFMAQKYAPDQLKQVVRTICLSAEFKAAWGQKLKRPFEAAAGMLRATNATFTSVDSDLFWYFDGGGQPLFSRRSPDGYPDKKSDWSNTTSMMQRWRFANRLVQNGIDDVSVSLLSQMPVGTVTPNQIVNFWIDRLLGRPMDTPTNREAVLDFMAQGRGPDSNLPADQIADRLPHMVALILMTPEFQWR